MVGLPDPRKDHAVIMARFARDCMQTVNDLTKKLEVTLGPDTGDLQIRIGLHSGPVTAGVVSDGAVSSLDRLFFRQGLIFQFSFSTTIR